ncbi:MAG: fasciclin domain-containing protein [Pseudomonadota bacterium]
MNRRTLLKLGTGFAGIALIAACAAPSEPDIVDIAAANPDTFGTLVAAVQAAGLVDTLKGDGPFTVFAPTNAAFERLPAGTVESLLQPENQAQLTDILTYHVVPGAITSDQLAGRRQDVATVQGGTVHIDGRNGVRVNNSRVTRADILASNGVIHVIDRVLLP